MLGNFEYYNPTKLYFGEQALDGLRKELPKYGKIFCWFTAAVRFRRMAFMIKSFPSCRNAARRL